jgi:anti-sigma factor RsiW
MNHMDHIEAQLPAYLDGRLDAAEHARVAAHVESCAACARAADDYRAVERLLDLDAAPAPLGPMWPAIARRRDPARRRATDYGFALAAAASLTAGFMLGVLAIDDGTAPSASAPAAARTATPMTDADWLTSSEPTLSDVYFFDAAGGGENAP